jgi:hypothetical protein
MSIKFNLFRASIVAFAAVALVLQMPLQTAQAADTRNCDNNALIFCGAMTKSELVQKMNQPANKSVFDRLGIHSSEVSSMIPMVVYKDGHVVAGGKTVARDVWSTGRQNMPGSHEKDGVFWRHPSVSFLDNSLDGWASMTPDGQFRFGILKSCGNAIMPITPPKPPKPPKPKKVTVTIPVNVTATAHSVDQCPDGSKKETITATGKASGSVEGTGTTQAEAIKDARSKIPAEVKKLTPIAQKRAKVADEKAQQVAQKKLVCTTSTPPTTPPTVTPPTVQTPAPLAQSGAESAAGGLALSGLSIGGYALRRSKQQLLQAITNR